MLRDWFISLLFPVFHTVVMDLNDPSLPPYKMLDGVKLIEFIKDDYYMELNHWGNWLLVPDLEKFMENGFEMTLINDQFYFFNDTGFLLTYVDVTTHLILPFALDLAGEPVFIEDVTNMQILFNWGNLNIGKWIYYYGVTRKLLDIEEYIKKIEQHFATLLKRKRLKRIANIIHTELLKRSGKFRPNIIGNEPFFSYRFKMRWGRFALWVKKLVKDHKKNKWV